MTLKSLEGQIKRAREGVPVWGKLPYGRTWLKESGWDVDTAKQQMIQHAAQDFLIGETITELEKDTGLSARQLLKLFGGGRETLGR